jgi:D-tyrosyl-tRNA(Tyr) deacylase
VRALVQRVSHARVQVDGEDVAAIGRGLLALVGVTHTDTAEDVRYIAEKVANLRLFPDGGGRFDRSVLDIAGEVLVVSQFTLYAETRRGRRPSFVAAAAPEVAAPLVDALVARLQETGLRVQTGRFGAMMQVELMNDGPVTIMVDSADRERPRRSAETGRDAGLNTE